MIPHANNEKEQFDDIDLSYNNDKEKKLSWHDRILLNRPLKVATAVILTAIIIPVLLYQYVFFHGIEHPPSDGFSFGSCLIQRDLRLPCGVGNVSRSECHSECCYDFNTDFCFHRYPSRFSFIVSENWTEDVLLVSRTPTVPYKSQLSFPTIRLFFDEVSATHLSLNFYRSDEPIIGRKLEDKSYAYTVSEGELQVVVNSTQGVIFDTTRGPFIASNDIWEMVFKLTDETMYGLGEIPLAGETTKVIYNYKGGLSSIPLIYAKSSGSYHALLIDTVNPTEITIGNDNRIVIRSITNLGLKFHLFVGPKPADIMKDVMAMLQVENKLEYWMLGTHICSNPALTTLASFITSARTEGMPFESHCGNGPATFSTECDSAYETLVRSGATVLRNAAKKFVPHVSPYILYTPMEEVNDTSIETTLAPRNLNDNRCFDDDKYRDYILADPSAENLYIGTVDDEDVIYPLYNLLSSDDNITEEFWQDIWVYGDVDAVVLENNWPLDESVKTDMFNYLPYYSANFDIAFDTTPKWNATRPERYFYTHNKYGNEFSLAFELFKSVPIFSTSQWMNGNVVINRQNIETSWNSLQKELIEMSLGGISGHRYWSTPVCGDTENFDGTTHAELCTKWYMAATYFPMIKVDSKNNSRDPLTFTGTSKPNMIAALKTRMSLMPYFYTVLQEGPLLRPMFYQFPLAEKLESVTTQFSVGDDLLIVPNLLPSQIQVNLIMPPGQWYEAWSGLKIEGDEGKVVTMPTTSADLLTLIRGGSILALQKDVRLTTAETQKMSAYSIIIALHCETRNITNIDEGSTTVADEQTTSTTVDGRADNRADTTADSTTVTTTVEPTTTEIPTITECSAQGKLYMAPNLTVVFKADDETLTITAEGDDFSVACDRVVSIWSPEVWDVDIYGLDKSHNNYDEHRHIPTFLSLCALQNQEHIVLNLV